MALGSILKIIWDTLDINLTDPSARRCWFCLNVIGIEEKAFIIRPCKCRGCDRECVHISCLKTFVNRSRSAKCVHCNAPFPVVRKVISWLQVFRYGSSTSGHSIKFSLLRDLVKYTCYIVGILSFSTMLSIGFGFLMYFIYTDVDHLPLRIVLISIIAVHFIFGGYYCYRILFAKLRRYIKRLRRYGATWEINYDLLRRKPTNAKTVE